MNIIENYDPEGTPLYELNPGDLFTYGGSYYMRCDDPNILMNWTEEHKDDCPAVDMANGTLAWVDRNKKVPPIYARIRINGRAD
jgi:hypothetical protein